MTNDKYIPKLKASTEINNLIEAGEYITHLQDSGRHEEAVNGWDYYNVIYHVGNRWFNGLTNIMKTENEDRFYDITKIREIDPRPGSNAGLGEESSLITDNIRYMEEDVKNFYRGKQKQTEEKSRTAFAQAPRASANCFPTRC